ncbi:MAG: ABC transporter [Lysobacter sp.]|nr:ABC transporter [Lysobacter sp.]
MTTPRTHRPSTAGVPALLAACLATAVAGCAILGGEKSPVTVYAPEPRVPADPAWPQADWQLAIARPQATRMLDGLRIAVRPTPGELQVYKGASWAKSPGEQLEDAILRTLEDSGKLRAVARQGSGIAADCTLLTDLRHYEAVYAGGAVPSAVIELNAKLLSTDDQVSASRTFHEEAPAATAATADVAAAFGQALARVTADVSGWTLAAGAQTCHAAKTGR